MFSVDVVPRNFFISLNSHRLRPICVGTTRRSSGPSTQKRGGMQHIDDIRPDSDAADRVRLKRYLVATALIVLVVLVVPPEASSLVFLPYCYVTGFVVFRRVQRLPEPARGATLPLTIGGLFAVVALTLRAAISWLSGETNVFPSAADAFQLLSYVIVGFAIVGIIRRRVTQLTLDPILDAVVGGIAAALLQWSLVLVPYLRVDGIPGDEVAINLGYNIVTWALVLLAVLALVAGSTPSVSNRLLAAGLVMIFTSEVVATLVSAGMVSDSVQFAMSPIALVLSVAGLLHPSVVDIATPPSDANRYRRLTRRRVTVLALALLTPPVLMLWAAMELDVDSWYLLPAATSLALTPLVVVRLGRLVRQNEELASLEATLRGVGERLVSAETTEDVVRVITVGAEQVLGDNFVCGGLVAQPLGGDARASAGDVTPALDALAGVVDAGDQLVTGRVLVLEELHSTDSHWVAGLVVVQRTLCGALVLATRTPLSDDEANAVTQLCRETAIAFRAVEQTERQVRQRSEDRFAALIDNSSDIVAIIDEGMHLSYVSPVASRLLGYSPGDDPGDVSVMDLVHADDRAAAYRLLDDIRFGLRNIVEIRLRHSEGPYRWFEVGGMDLSSDPNINGIVLNAREIDDRKQAEERLLLSEARFKSLVQNSTDLVIVLDPSGAISYASPSVTGVLAETPEEIMGRPLDEVFRQSNVDWTSRLRTDPSRSLGSSELIEFNFDNAEGQLRSVETSLTDLRAEPAVGGFVLNARDVTDRKSMEQRIRYQATHDELTGLANRVHVLDDLAGMLGRNSGSTTVAAILLGIDDFKDINDSLGHAFGDLLLTSVAERITGMLSFGDIAARVGGDEFVVVLERAHGESHVTDLAEQLLTTISSPFVINGRELNVTASAGIVFDHDRTNTGDILLRNADIAMYRAKTMGKRQAVVFESQMHTASFDRLELRADLARAVTSDQFVAHYQPVFDLTSRHIVGCEALIRWDHPRRGLLGPGLFIPLAEESGLIDKLGEWILERACTDLARWREEYGAAGRGPHHVGQPVGAAAARRRHRPHRERHPRACRDSRRTPGARGDRVDAHHRHREDQRDDARAAPARCTPRGRRLRDGLLLARLHPAVRVRRAEDRQELRRRHRPVHQPADRHRGARPGPPARRAHDRRGHRDRTAGRPARGARLPPRPGLPVLTAGPPGGLPRAAERRSQRLGVASHAVRGPGGL